MKYTIYTDGACSKNPGKGGWAYIIIDENNNEKQYSGFQEYTTNNQMELQATINALKQVSKNDSITLYTDSQYVKNGITNWISNWKINNWKSSNKTPIKNKDLWVELDSISSSYNIDWQWVKGHAGDKYNTIVDKLARTEILKHND